MGPSEQRFPVALSHQKPSNHLDWLSCVCSYLEHSPSIEQSTDKIQSCYPHIVCLFGLGFRSSEQRFPVAISHQKPSNHLDLLSCVFSFLEPLLNRVLTRYVFWSGGQAFWSSCVFNATSEQKSPFALSHQKPSNHLDRLSYVFSYLEHSPSIEQSTDKMNHIFMNRNTSWLVTHPSHNKGFLLHSHIKRQVIIWIGCHVFAPIEQSTDKLQFSIIQNQYTHAKR